jgi:hypothetical protein
MFSGGVPDERNSGHLDAARRLRLAGIALYFCLALGWTYGILDRETWAANSSFAAEVWIVLFVYLVLGAMLSSWAAVLLPVLTFLLQLPANEGPRVDGRDNWVPGDGLYFSPYALVGVVAGTLIGKRLVAGRLRGASSRAR